MIDDDDNDDEKEKKRSVARHKGTGIIGEYMKEGRELAPPSNSVPVDLTKGMFIVTPSNLHFSHRKVLTCNFRW